MPSYRNWTPNAVLRWAKMHYEEYGFDRTSIYQHINYFDGMTLESINLEGKLKGIFAFKLATEYEGVTRKLWPMIEKQGFNLEPEQVKELWIVNKTIDVLIEVFYEYHRLSKYTKKEHKKRIQEGCKAAKLLRSVLSQEVSDYHLYPFKRQVNFKGLTAYFHREHLSELKHILLRNQNDHKFEVNEADCIDLSYALPNIDYILFHLEKHLERYLDSDPFESHHLKSEKSILPYFVRKMSSQFRKVCGAPCNHITAELALFLFGGEELYCGLNIDSDYVKDRVKEHQQLIFKTNNILLSPYHREFTS